MEILPSLGMEEKENGDSTITSITNDHITLSISDIKHDNETVPGICLICLCEFNPTEDSIYTLPCTHKYCFTCLESYLESNILEGKILVKCFHIENYGDTTDGKTLPACNTVIPESCVKEILMNKPDIFAKYTRFSFLKSNVYARECPSCLHLQLGDPKAPQMSCESCGTRYCLTHALAHPETMTCAAYEQSIAAETQVNVEAITLISKPCPGCGIFVSKSDGCNHMKCPNCSTSFCWLCGKAVDDSVFPAHFQWWNLTGCANMQMVEDIVPTQRAIIFARLTALLQTLIIGPLSVVSSLLSIFTCCLCIPCIINRNEFKPLQFFQNCVVGWGFFWLFLLFFFPLAVIGGILFLTFLLLISPCYIYQKVKRGQIPYLTCQQCLSDVRELFRPPRPAPPPERITTPPTGSSSTESDVLYSKMEASEPQPPIHNSIELVLSSHTLNRRHSRRYTSSGSIRSMRSLSLYVYCPNGHIMKPITKGDYPISPSVKVNHSGDAITTEEVSDIENQIFPPSCHGSKHNQDNGPDFPAVEYHCSVCQYYLCENCYTDELKRLNNIPVHRSPSTGRESDSENTNISPRDVDVESRHVLPTESGDTEEKNSLRGERHVETMSVQVEVDNFSVKSVTDVASVHNSEYLLSKVGNSNVHVSSEDALSDQDIDSLSMNPFKLVPMQLNSTPRKLSVSGLTYSSIDSDSLRDDDSMSHFRVEGRNILTEQPTMEDDDNMTSISTIHSDTMDVTSRSVYVPKKGLTSNDLNRRRFTLSHEDTPSISGHGLVDLNSSQHSENSDHDDDHDDDDDDVDADLHGTHVDDSSRENIKEEYSQILLLSNKIDGEESISDSGIDNDDENMSIGSIDSTKCYPNNLYHSKGFLTIASLHKTDSPSGYLTHHLSALPTSTLRYTNNNFRRTTTKAPSPSQSHIHSPVIEEEELILHTSSNLSHMNSPTIQTDEIHCAIEETHEEDERSREQQQLASL